MLKRTFVSIIVITVAVFWTVTDWAGETDTININTASIEELVKLKRVGPKYAARIIEYRENNGPFEKPEDIIPALQRAKEANDTGKAALIEIMDREEPAFSQ